MATPNYQIPNKITFYPSYPQYAHVAGLISYTELDHIINKETGLVDNDYGLTEEERFNLITLDPSNTTRFMSLNTGQVFYQFSDPTYNPLNFDFWLVLGHKAKEDGGSLGSLAIRPRQAYFDTVGESGGGQDPHIYNGDVVNGGNTPALNGWSLSNITGNLNANDMTQAPNLNFSGFGIRLVKSDGSDIDTEIGCCLWGKKWEAPQNTDISSSISYNYGIKNKKTIAGKNITNINYYKPNKWLLDAWELDDTASDTRDTPTESRNGLRTWNVRWSFLQDKYATNQNNMRNSNLWTQDSDSEYSTGSDGTSLYNSTDGVDFYTSVLKMTMGSHLPVVIKISESNNPDQWAVVRIAKHKISQKNPKFLDISLTLEEQV